MKTPYVYLAIIGVALVLLTSYLIHRKSLEEQVEELNARSRAERFLVTTPPDVVAADSNSETLVRSLYPMERFALIDKLTFKLHAAAAQEFFNTAGVVVSRMNPKYYYELNSSSPEWVTLIGETTDGKAATLVAAAKVESKEKLIGLIEKQWKVLRSEWKRINNVKVNDCTDCEVYHFKYRKEYYVLIIGKSEASDLVHAVAELAQPSQIRAHAQALADRLSFKNSRDF